MNTSTTQSPDSLGSPSGSARSFTARLAVTDGGDPIDLIEDSGCGQVWRGDAIVGSGSDLNSAWDDYLHSCHPAAPVREAELEAMWAQYDGQNTSVVATAAEDSDKN